MKKSIRRILQTLVATSVVVTVGTVTVFADETESVGVVAEGEDVKAEYGDINVDSDDGLWVYAADGGSADVTAGNITTTGEGEIYGDALYVEADGGKVDVSTGQLTSYLDGAYVEANEDGSAMVNVDGNINADNNGVDVTANDDSSASVTVEGDISAGNEGVSVSAIDNGTADVTVNGDVSSENYALRVGATDEASSKVIVDGEVSSDSSIGLYTATMLNGTVDVKVTGDVTGVGTGASFSSVAGGKTTVEIGGDINVVKDKESDSDSNGMLLFSFSGSPEYSVTVDGDVSGADYGISVMEMVGKDEYASYDIAVGGTISGTIAPVYVLSLAEKTELTLTAWKIDLNDSGKAVQFVRAEAEGPVEVDVDPTIRYIVKLAQPDQGNILSVTSESGAALPTSHNFEYALEGEKVICKIGDGYKILAAYNGEGKEQQLLKDENGNYYMIVPKGGGVFLTVDAEAEKYNLTFDLDGGMIDGKTEYTVEAAYGTKIKIPKPTKEGYEFLYFEGSMYYAGDEYLVEGPHSFKAIWAESKTEEAVNGLPATGEKSGCYETLGGIMILISLSAGSFVVFRKKEEN